MSRTELLSDAPVLPGYVGSGESPGGTNLATSALAVVDYRAGDASTELRDGVVHILVPADGNDVRETWAGDRPVERSGVAGEVAWTEDGENLFAAVSLPDAQQLSEGVRSAYRDLLELAESLAFGHVYRVWNFMGGINAHNSSGLERYRDFCHGRALAFEDLAWQPETIPSGTGIGFASGGVSIFLLAHRTGGDVNIENPLQLPAYRYPRRYGPKSPSFARATAVGSSSAPRIFVSGTASIRDHRTIGDTLDEQIRITAENLEALVDRANAHWETSAARFESLKIYVRDEAHLERVASDFRDRFQVDAAQSPALRADICRADLLIEVEGVIRGDDDGSEQ